MENEVTLQQAEMRIVRCMCSVKLQNSYVTAQVKPTLHRNQQLFLLSRSWLQAMRTVGTALHRSREWTWKQVHSCTGSSIHEVQVTKL